jgi:hypothetical protein
VTGDAQHLVWQAAGTMPSKAENTKQTEDVTRKQRPRPVTLQQDRLEKATLARLSVQRTVVNPSLAQPANILALQRAYGNQAVTRLIQPFAPSPTLPSTALGTGRAGRLRVQANGVDFGRVRVRADTEAMQLSSELSAQAFSHGQDIYMGEGKHDLSSDAGKRLLGHELTHVVQQTGTQVQRQPEPNVQRVDLGAHRGPPIGADIGREGRTIIYDAGISAGDTAQNKVVKIFRSFVNRARSKWHYAATGASARPNQLLESGGAANCGALAGAFIKLVRDQAPGIQAGYDRDDDRLNRPLVTTEADIFDQNIYGNVKEFRGKTRYEDIKRCVFPMHSRARVAGRIYDPTVYNGIGTDIIDFKVRRVGKQDPVSNEFVAYENEDYKVIRLGESPAGFGEGFKIISKHPWKKGFRWKMGKKPKA